MFKPFEMQQGIQRIYIVFNLYLLHHQALCMVFGAACADDSMMLLPVLDQMMNGLYLQVRF